MAEELTWRRRYGGYITFTGAETVAIGTIWMGVALLLHVEYFWNASPRLTYFEQVGKLIAYLIIAGGAASLLIGLFA